MTTYFLETPLSFASDIQVEVLDICKNRPEELLFRNPAWRMILDETPYHEIEKLIGVAKAREIKRRRFIMLKLFGLKQQISFLQYSLPDNLNEAFIESCPEWIPRDEIIPIVQISTGGEMLYPHKGHFRKASLFCLLEGSNEITRWYDETEPFDLISEYRIPDMSRCQVAAETVLKINTWTLFNHHAWHSVHAQQKNIDFRVNIGIDFKSFDAEQVRKLVEENV
jgi:hypothetical protein